MAAEPRRLNWGCGEHVMPGWINTDSKEGPHIDISCDIRDGLPFEDGSIDYAVSIHALPEIQYPDLVPVLRELRRVLRGGGRLRLGLPDLQKAIEAHRRGDRGYFLIPDTDATSLGGKFVLQMIWYGHSRTLFLADFVEELLRHAGFAEVHHVGYRQTAGPFPDIVELDNRENESLFVEAVK
jgi:predicted SAM-dependent methyltransferase